MWHHAQYRGDELIVLGYDPRKNDCMLIRLSGLPMNEQSELRKIAASRSAQESSYLIPILRRMESPNGHDWFSYLCKKMEQRNSPVFVLPIKEIQDSLDQDQKAIFKGYGKGRTNRSLEVDDLERAQTGGLERLDRMEDREFLPDTYNAETELSRVSIPTKPSEVEQKIDSLVESNRQTNALLNRLVDVMLAEKQAPTKKAAPKTTATRKSRQKPDLSKLGHNQGPPMELDERV